MKSILLCLIMLFGLQLWAQSEKLSPRLETPKKMGKPTYNGLNATYYQGRWVKTQVLARVDPEINFDWGIHSPAPEVAQDYFSVLWEGGLYAPRSGNYTFLLLVDEGVKLWLNEQLLIDAWDNNTQQRFSGSLFLPERSLQAIKLEYHETKGSSLVKLFWQYESEEAQIIDQRFLFSTPVKSAPKEEKDIFQEFFSLFEFEKKPSETSPILSIAQPEIQQHPDSAHSQFEQAFIKSHLAQEPKPPPPITESHTKDRLPIPDPDSVIVLEKIRFERSKYALQEKVYEELNQLIDLLMQYSDLQIEVIGHTDHHPKSNPEANYKLSLHRAQAVADYFIRFGIAPHRISVQGYGGSQPLASNESSEGRSQNRRVEVRVK